MINRVYTSKIPSVRDYLINHCINGYRGSTPIESMYINFECDLLEITEEIFNRILK